MASLEWGLQRPGPAPRLRSQAARRPRGYTPPPASAPANTHPIAHAHTHPTEVRVGSRQKPDGCSFIPRFLFKSKIKPTSSATRIPPPNFPHSAASTNTQSSHARDLGPGGPARPLPPPTPRRAQDQPGVEVPSRAAASSPAVSRSWPPRGPSLSLARPAGGGRRQSPCGARGSWSPFWSACGLSTAPGWRSPRPWRAGAPAPES